jgi:hypothetical protein
MTFALALAACATFAGQEAQAAGPDPIAPAYGNTVLATYADGRSQKIWLHPDGRWTGLGRNGARLAGRWQLKGEKVCMRQSMPPTLPIAFCTPFPQHSQPGVQWASHDAAGRPVRLSLQRGMPVLAQNQSR